MRRTMQIQEVEEAYDSLVLDEKEPSLRNVRERLGYGSWSQIGPMIAEVRTARVKQAAALVEMSDEMKLRGERLVQALWTAMTEEKDSAIAAVRAEAMANLDGAIADRKQALEAADAVQRELELVSREKQALAGELESAREAKAAAETAAAVAAGRLEAAEKHAAALERSLGLAMTRSGRTDSQPSTVDNALVESVAIEVINHLLDTQLISEMDMNTMAHLIADAMRDALPEVDET